MSNDTLQVRRIGIDTYHENVAYMNRECGIYRAEGFQALSKIQVSTNGSKVLAVLNVVDDVSIVQPGELGLSEQAFNQLNVAEGMPGYCKSCGTAKVHGCGAPQNQRRTP